MKYLHPTLTHLGTDRTYERGAVNVFRHDGPSSPWLEHRPVYVTSIDAPISREGVPQGLREAPIGILLASRGHSVADGASIDFKPV